MKLALVKAGLDILSEKGVEKISLRVVAKKAGVSHAAPYHHFKSKDYLICELMKTGFALQTQYFNDYVSKAKKPEEILFYLSLGFVTFSMDHKNLHQLMTTRGVPRSDWTEDLKEGYAICFTTFTNFVDEFLTKTNSKINKSTYFLSLATMLQGICLAIANGRLITASEIIDPNGPYQITDVELFVKRLINTLKTD